MSTAFLVSIEEYLRTSFDPDREYLDGRIVERNLGEKDHSYAQGEIYFYFRSLGRKAGVFCYLEQRVQVTPTRFRVPDVCLYVGGDPAEQVFRTPPFLVVEILSKDDRASDVQEKIHDYLSFGVRFVWVIDPRLRRGYVHTAAGSQQAMETLWTKDPEFALPLAQLFCP